MRISFVIVVFLLSQAHYAFAWNPPIGIPAPAWPADLDMARPTLPSPWTSDQAGYYFIKTSGCSDSGRTYGNPSAPRCSMPTSPAAGTVVVFDGDIAAQNVDISASGTSSNPVWFMGYNPAHRPTWTGVDNGAEGYIIFDNINFNGNGNRGGFNTGDHVFIRNCNFTNSYSTANYAALVTSGNTTIIYNCQFGPIGNWEYSGSEDLDCHGMKLWEGTNNIWIVDNTFFNIQGDGVQSGESSFAQNAINHVYMGRNTGYKNMQSCLWVKTGVDIIISENTCYDMDVHDSSGSSVGQAFGAQYDPSYVWFIANKMHDTWAGIHIAGPNNGNGGPFYVIGNLAYNIDGDYDCDAYNAGAYGYRNAGGATFIFNTAYNSEIFYTGATGSATVRNNVFSQRIGSCSGFEIDNQNITHDYNLYSSSGDDPGTESHRKIEIPSATFTSAGSDFSLKSDSLAVGNANPTEEAAFAAFQTRYGIDIRKDILGTVRPQSTTWDIGAYEYMAGGGEPVVYNGSFSGSISGGGVMR